MKKQKETFYFFHINNAPAFKVALKSYLPKITSTATLLSPPSSQPLAFVNVAFSQTGLTTLGITDNLGDSQFSSGQFADAENLGDDTSQWEAPFKGTNIHGVFLIGSDQVHLSISRGAVVITDREYQTAYTTQYANDITSTFGSSITKVYEIDAAARPGSEAGHER